MSLFTALLSMAILAAGASAIAKKVNEAKDASTGLEELKRHNRASEAEK